MVACAVGVGVTDPVGEAVCVTLRVAVLDRRRLRVVEQDTVAGLWDWEREAVETVRDVVTDSDGVAEAVGVGGAVGDVLGVAEGESEGVGVARGLRDALPESEGELRCDRLAVRDAVREGLAVVLAVAEGLRVRVAVVVRLLDGDTVSDTTRVRDVEAEGVAEAEGLLVSARLTLRVGVLVGGEGVREWERVRLQVRVALSEMVPVVGVCDGREAVAEAEGVGVPEAVSEAVRVGPPVGETLRLSDGDGVAVGLREKGLGDREALESDGLRVPLRDGDPDAADRVPVALAEQVREVVRVKVVLRVGLGEPDAEREGGLADAEGDGGVTLGVRPGLAVAERVALALRVRLGLKVGGLRVAVQDREGDREPDAVGRRLPVSVAVTDFERLCVAVPVLTEQLQERQEGVGVADTGLTVWVRWRVRLVLAEGVRVGDADGEPGAVQEGEGGEAVAVWVAVTLAVGVGVQDGVPDAVPEAVGVPVEAVGERVGLQLGLRVALCESEGEQERRAVGEQEVVREADGKADKVVVADGEARREWERVPVAVWVME